MAWKTPRTWVTGETVTSTQLNAHVRDNLNALYVATVPRQPTWYITGTIATGTNKSAEFVWDGQDGTIVRARARVKTAPTDADLIVDININGTSIWNSTQANRVKVAAGQTAGAQTSFDTTTITEGDVLTIDVDQVGSTVAGANLTVSLYVTVTPLVA